MLFYADFPCIQRQGLIYSVSENVFPLLQNLFIPAAYKINM